MYDLKIGGVVVSAQDEASLRLIRVRTRTRDDRPLNEVYDVYHEADIRLASREFITPEALAKLEEGESIDWSYMGHDFTTTLISRRDPPKIGE